MKAGRSTWIALTALAALVLVAATWFTLLSPRLDRIAAAHEERDLALERNQQLEIEITAARAEDARIGQLRTELAALRTQLPASIDLPDFTRGLDELATASGARVRSITLGSTVQVVTVPELPDAPDGTVAPLLPEPPQNLYAVPVTMTIEGTFEQAQQYADALQSTGQRLFLLSRLSWTQADQDGTASFAINGHAYVLTGGGA